MNTKLLIFVGFILFIGNAKAATPEEAGLFILGFAEGISVEVAGNITACVIDAKVTLDDFDTGFSDVGDGIEHLDIKQVKTGLALIGNGTKEIGTVFQVCGIDAEGAKLVDIGEQLAEGKILDVIGGTVIDILFHKKTIKDDLQNAKEAWASGQYESSGKYYGEVVAIILKDA